MSAQIQPRIQPATEPVCCGTCCPQRGACQLYAAMEQREEDTPVIDTCIDGGGRWPMFRGFGISEAKS